MATDSVRESAGEDAGAARVLGAALTMQDDTSTGSRRLRVPLEMEVDALRSCVDSALRLFGEDAHAKFGRSMENAHGPDWPEVVARNNRAVTPVDPLFWMHEMQNPSSAARANPALQNLPNTFRRRLAHAAATRNAHCHYAPGADDPGEVVERLRAILLAAGELRLRCERDIRAAVEVVTGLHTGTTPIAPSFRESVALASKNVELSSALTAAEVRAAEQAERADRAYERVSELQGRLEAAETALAETAEVRAELAEAQAEAARRRQEAEISEQHRRDIESHQKEVDAAQASSGDLPPTVGEVLAHVYAAGIGALGIYQQLAEAGGLEDGDNLAIANLAREQAQKYANILDILGVSRRHVEGLPGVPELDADWINDHANAAEALTNTGAWALELAELGESSSAVLQGLASQGEEYRLIADQAWARLLEFQNGGVTSPVSSTMVREISDGTQIAPGEAWPYERGDQVWVLSAQRRSMRYGRDGPRLGAQLGDAIEERVVDAFLSIRPTGGRVFVDDDGDAATYCDGELIYLGQIPD